MLTPPRHLIPYLVRQGVGVRPVLPLYFISKAFSFVLSKERVVPIELFVCWRFL